MEDLLEYHHHPIPTICDQAVHVVCWFYLVVGAFAAQPWCYSDSTSIEYFFQVKILFKKIGNQILGIWVIIRILYVCTYNIKVKKDRKNSEMDTLLPCGAKNQE